MKKSIVLILILLLTTAFSAQAEAHESSLGYCIDIPSGWVAISPDSVDVFEAKLNADAAEALASFGLTTDYINDYDNRAFDQYVNLNALTTDGNFIIRRLSEALGSSFGDFEGCRSYLEKEVLPIYVTYYGAEVIREAEVSVVGGREFAGIEIKVGDRMLSQWITCDPASDTWFNFTFTKVSDANRNLVLETLTFPAETVETGEGLPFESAEFKAMVNLELGKEADA